MMFYSIKLFIVKIVIILVTKVLNNLCLDVAEIANEVYMEVIVGDDDTGDTAAATTVHEQQQMDDSEMKSAFLPIPWTAAYGK